MSNNSFLRNLIYRLVTGVLVSLIFFLLLPFGLISKELMAQAQKTEAEEVLSRIKALEAKIAQTRSQEQTLIRDIALIESDIELKNIQIAQAQYQINEKEKELDFLQEDIGLLEIRLDRLSGTIEHQREILSARIRQQYIDSKKSTFEILISSSGMGDFMSRIKYLQEVQAEAEELLARMSLTKDNYELQKTLLKEKKAEVEQIKREIEVQKAHAEVLRVEAEQRKVVKNYLLDETKSDEGKYKKLLEQAKAELEAIRKIVEGINFENGIEIEKGDPIAVMGNSGYPYCSSGAHLHLEVRKDGIPVNPAKYLKSKKVYVWHYANGDKKIGDGKWDWPMKGSIEITQLFGSTPWSVRYPSGKHDGIDMKSSNTVIYAPDDGIAVKGTMGCSSAVIKYVAIKHKDDIVSYYLHVK